MSWNPQRVEQLKTFWAAGESAAVIATTLVTRNAVIGKVHRLRLRGRNSARQARKSGNQVFASRGRSRKKRPAASRTAGLRIPRRRSPKAIPELGDAPRENVTIAALAPYHCRWPEGDPKTPDFHFCGRAVGAAGPYCPHHAARACA
jgi:GcrA cell cycle regulator